MSKLPDDVTITPASKLKDRTAIAEGGFGVVYLARHEDWGRVAYKKLKAKIITKEQHGVAEELIREAKVQRLRHPNIVSLLGVTFEEKNYGVVLEYVAHGSLDGFMFKFRIGLPWKLHIARDVTLGMNYLHTQAVPIIHGDMKVQNVLIGSEFTAKICDFGLAKWKQYSSERTSSRSHRGTVTHIPPESWSNVNAPRTVKCDVYSFGVLLWELLSEKKPFEKVPVDLVAVAVKDGQRLDMAAVDERQVVPQEVKSVITDCWAQEPDSRPMFSVVKDQFHNLLEADKEGVEIAVNALYAQEKEKNSSKAAACDVLADGGAVGGVTELSVAVPYPDVRHRHTRRPRLQSTLHTKGDVCGVTQLDDRIYVVCGSDIILVFDSHYKRLKDIPVEGLKGPRDIVVCRESRVMYVSDRDNDCVWRVTEKHDVNKFVSNVKWPKLSVTSRRLLVTSNNNKLRLFEADGKQLKQVSLPDDMKPLHAVETDNNTFVVSHRRRQHGVSEIDFDGHVIRVCSEQLNWPRHLALDVDGRVFVADRDNHRVLLLNKQLQLERVLLDKEHDELNQPWCLCYLPETGRLLVGEEEPGCVKVYSLMD